MSQSLPTGTVTFVFTDIESSTRLLHELGPDYHQALAQHHRVLREAISGAGGREVSTHGDAFFAVFTEADGAVAAATTAQQQLATQEWPRGRELRVRIGIHTGAGVVGADDYVGIDVHAAARVCSAGHGGQVLLTRAARDAIVTETPLLELGHHVLKDLEETIELFQLAVDGLPQQFPPLKTLTNTNLPEPPTPIIGRTREVHYVRELLLRSDTRLVTLTGPAAAARRASRSRSAASWWRSSRTASRSSRSAASTTPRSSCRRSARHSASRRRAAARSRRRCTTPQRAPHAAVLDNFEHVLGAAPLLAERSRARPDVTVLVTSRSGCASRTSTS